MQLPTSWFIFFFKGKHETNTTTKEVKRVKLHHNITCINKLGQQKNTNMARIMKRINTLSL